MPPKSRSDNKHSCSCFDWIGRCEHCKGGSSVRRNVNNRKRTIERQNEKSAAKTRKIAAKVTPEKGFGLSEIEIEEARLMANDYILKAKLDENESSKKKGSKKRTEDRRTASAYNLAFFTVKAEIENQKKTGEKRRLTQEITESICQHYGVSVCASTINKKIRSGAVMGEKLKPGPKSKYFSEEEYNALKGAFVTMIALRQAQNKPELKTSDMYAILGNLLAEKKQTSGKNLYERLRKDCALDLSCEGEYYVELRRMLWTTSMNLNQWYDMWKEFLVEKGFASDEPVKDPETGKVISEVRFAPDQINRIINLDENLVDLDGTSGAAGGRPPSVLIVQGVSRTGTAASKSSCSTTFIMSVTAGGDVGPPHIQYSTEATTDDNKKVKPDWIIGLPR